MNANLSQHRLWYCHENGLNKTIQTILVVAINANELQVLYRLPNQLWNQEFEDLLEFRPSDV